MTVRVGFIGTGGIAGSHLANLVRMPQAEVVALCDLVPETIEATRERVNSRVAKILRDEGGSEANAPKLKGVAYTDMAEMLKKENLDAAYVCLPPFAHGGPEEAVIEAGVPMLVEKPLGLDLSRTDEIRKKAEAKGLVTAVGYQLRYASWVQKAKELLQNRTVGMVTVMRFGSTPGKEWYRIQARSGGQLVEMATHQVDMLRYLVGEIETVYAAAATRINNKKQPDYDIFDVNCMTLWFENGAVGNFANNFITGHGSPSEARGLHIFAEDMTISVGGSLKVITPDGTEEIAGENEPMYSEDEAFVNAAASGDGAGILSNYADGMKSLAVTLAAETSARERRPVDVKDFIAQQAPGALSA